MRWNPILNAFAATAYIGAVALLIRYISSFRHDTPDTPLDSMAFLSLLVFSAAVMAFLFFCRPAMFLIENRKQEALTYFFQTLASFGIVTAIAIAAMIVAQ